MAAKDRKIVRCAIYTRVSTDQGLDQDFNSLDAQYDASQSYIRSQKHAGWTLIGDKYDDGGFSGGNTDRPALQRLLSDVSAGKIDVIVVYKVDRLTRSLADFAKLVELFDKHGVSFVSVTQQFNTTTSMGRLTLNVLLSFAQFEREVTSERIRDKIAASKRKGLWVGGNLPLGYALKDRKLTIVSDEAELVRSIFRTYLQVGSIDRVAADLRGRGILTKRRNFKNGRRVGGCPFTRGPLSYLLRNRFYVGEVVYKGEVFPGPQPPLLARDLFDRVQARLAEQLNNHKTIRKKSQAPLLGKIFDDQGNLMSPSHTRKKGKKYRYYISSCLVQGRKDLAGSTYRVPAVEFENTIASNLRKSLAANADCFDNELLSTAVERIDIGPSSLLVSIKVDQLPGSSSKVRIPWKKPPSRRRREILLPAEAHNKSPAKPIRSEARARVIAGIARARSWLDEIVSGSTKDVAEIATREGCTIRSVNRTLSLAFLAPSLVEAALNGTLPYGIGYTRLCDLPPAWSHQYRALGLASQVSDTSGTQN